MEPQDRFGDPWERRGKIGDLQRGQIDVAEQRVAHDIADPPGIIVGILARQLGHIDLVGAGEAQQQLGGDWALIAFEQRDIAGGHIEIARHALLGQTQFAAQTAQTRAEIKRAGLAHRVVLNEHG